jgi:hypothetical protein
MAPNSPSGKFIFLISALARLRLSGSALAALREALHEHEASPADEAGESRPLAAE